MKIISLQGVKCKKVLWEIKVLAISQYFKTIRKNAKTKFPNN